MSGKSVVLLNALVLLLCSAVFAQSNPTPFVSLPLVPDQAPPGGTSFTLSVSGSGFTPQSVVNWNAIPLATTFVSNSRLTATVPGSDLGSRGTASITVATPPPGGGTSDAAYFQISTPTRAFGLFQSPLSSTKFRDLAAADVNDDGKVDLVLGDVSDSNITVLLGNGDGTFQPGTGYAAGLGAYHLVTGDLNNDGHVDVVALPYQSSTVAVLLGNGDGTFQPFQNVSIGSFEEKAALGDLNHDGNLDLVVTTANAGGTVSVLLGNGDGTFQPHVDYPAGSEPRGVAIGDFNGDGNLDVAAPDYNPFGSSSLLYVFLGNGDGTLQNATTYITGSMPQGIVSGDFDADGKQDLVVNNTGSTGMNGTVSVYLGNGDGTFQPQVQFSAGNDPFWIQTADLNGDGKLDILCGSDTQSVGITESMSVLLGNGDGTFQPDSVLAVKFGTYAGDTAIADFDGDGKMDLAAANVLGPMLLMLQSPIALSTTFFTFPLEVIGQNRGPENVIRLTNGGTSALQISNMVLGGLNPEDFTETSNCPSSLAANSSCSIGLVFTPPAQGTFYATLSIYDPARGSPQTILFNGEGVPTIVSLSASSWLFGHVAVGMSSQTGITLTNFGGVPVHITGTTIFGKDPGDFSQTNTCGNLVAAGQTCKFSVIFTPSQVGLRLATLAISDDGGQSPQLITFKGTGD